MLMLMLFQPFGFQDALTIYDADKTGVNSIETFVLELNFFGALLIFANKLASGGGHLPLLLLKNSLGTPWYV